MRARAPSELTERQRHHQHIPVHIDDLNYPDDLVRDSMVHLVETGNYPPTATGDALLIRDCHSLVSKVGTTLANIDIVNDCQMAATA